MNLSHQVVRIPFAAIASLTRTPRLVASLLVVAQHDGQVTEFVCWSRDEVIAAVAPHLAQR